LIEICFLETKLLDLLNTQFKEITVRSAKLTNMTHQQFIQAIRDCDNGILNFNKGKKPKVAFLYNGKWYPLHAIVNKANGFIGTKNPNTHRSLNEISGLHLWLRTEEIKFTNNFPVNITQIEVADEVRQLSKILYQLTK